MQSSHGTVTAVAGGNRYEITTLRRDERTDGRHAEVAFTDDWREDAARRDFTINAMSAAPDGALHDYFGGQADLEAGRVRFVGDPATRIAEDHLRLLRFFRFHAWYGHGAPDKAALAACKAAAHTIPSLSGERVQAEMLKLLAAPDPLAPLAAMRDAGVLAQLLPEASEAKRLARLSRSRAVSATAILYGGSALSSLTPKLHTMSPPAGGSPARMLRASRPPSTRPPLPFTLTSRPSTVTHRAAPIAPALDRRAQRRLVYELGRETLSRRSGLLYDAWSAEDGDEYEEVWRAMLETAEQWEVPTFPVTGADVLARGIPEGPEARRSRSPNRRSAARGPIATLRARPLRPYSSWLGLVPAIATVTHRRSSPTRCPEQVRA